MTPELELLLAERAIARALAEIARAMDERRWEALDGLVAEQATADFGLGPVAGRAAIVGVMRSFLDDCGPTQHLLGNLVVDVAADGAEASSRCYVSDMHVGTGDRRSSRSRPWASITTAGAEAATAGGSCIARSSIARCSAR
jgi:hypothetical protein